MILEAFDLSVHAELFVQGTKDAPELFAYRTFGPFSTTLDFEDVYSTRFSKDKDKDTCFAILAKSNELDKQGVFAGVIALQKADPMNAFGEIGFVCLPIKPAQTHIGSDLGIQITILPAFQRTFVTSNAVGLLLLYTLDSPPNGLGLRRCQWQTHAGNEPSKRVATRMCFTFEGVERFQRVVPTNKIGNGFDTSLLSDVLGQRLGPSRDSAIFAHYCDEWPEKRKQVVEVMERQ